MNEILRLRAEELLRLIKLELPQQDSRDFSSFIPAGIVLTGGSSNLPGIAELGSKVTRLPVRVGSPFNLYGIADSLCDPAYATAVGLLLWKKRTPVIESGWKQKTGIKRYFSDALAALAK
jgi:cell division protein FtsA